MKKLIIGNWKMNGRLAKLQSFVGEWDVLADQAAVEVGIAPPAPYLAALQNQAKDLLVCAQDVSHFANDGAYTGEVSAAMLADMGCRYVLVGHSERRQYFAEDNAILAQKLNAVMAQDMVPVLCVGETLAQRESGEYCQVIREQLTVLQDVDSKNHEFVVAYEPVWAIGTGKVASLEQIHDIHVEIKSWLLQNIGSADSIRVLYGGSVNEKNAEAIMSVPNVDGALVGGASLDAKAFRIICEAVEKLI